jgi:hypothetical protein
MNARSIPLSRPQPNHGLVKRTALVAFRALRVVTNQARSVPGVLAQAADDVRDAWAESARPNP